MWKSSARVRVYFYAFQMLTNLQRFIAAVFSGIWLGLLDDESVTEVDRIFYLRTGDWRDEAYNRQGLFYWEAFCVDSFCEVNSPIVVMSAGGGREAIALEQRGFFVEAYECNTELRIFANGLLESLGLNCRVEHVNRNEVPALEVGRYGSILVGWGSYMHIRGSETRVKFLTDLHRCLRPGGVIIISFFSVKRYNFFLRLTSRLAGFIGKILGRPPVELGDALDCNLVHFFSPEAIAKEVKSAGFIVEHYSDVPYGHCVARRPRPS